MKNIFVLLFLIAGFAFSATAQSIADEAIQNENAGHCYRYYYGYTRSVINGDNDGYFYFGFDANSLAYLLDPSQDNFEELIRFIKEANKEQRIVYAKIEACDSNKLISLSYTPDTEQHYTRR